MLFGFKGGFNRFPWCETRVSWRAVEHACLMAGLQDYREIHCCLLFLHYINNVAGLLFFISFTGASAQAASSHHCLVHQLLFTGVCCFKYFSVLVMRLSITLSCFIYMESTKGHSLVSRFVYLLLGFRLLCLAFFQTQTHNSFFTHTSLPFTTGMFNSSSDDWNLALPVLH